MTEQLERAVEQLKALPEEQQNAIASIIIEELEDESKWDASFAKSQKLLEQLAAEAEEEFHSNKTQPLDLTQL